MHRPQKPETQLERHHYPKSQIFTRLRIKVEIAYTQNAEDRPDNERPSSP
jgi:hypothetical protein